MLIVRALPYPSPQLGEGNGGPLSSFQSKAALQKSKALTPLPTGGGAGGEGQRIRAAPGIRLAMTPSGPIFSPFRKGGYRGIWADKVCADRYLDWCIFPCRQHPATCNTANAEPLRVLCRNPPSPPFTKGGIIPALADDLFDTAQQALPVFLPSPSWGGAAERRAGGFVQHRVSG